MKNKQLQEKLENYINQKGINIVKGRGNFRGGFCIINNENFFVINRNEPIEKNIIQMVTLIKNQIGLSSEIRFLLGKGIVKDK